MQDSFVAALGALGRFEGRSRLKCWLRRIVVNTALMKLRARRYRAEEPLDAIPANLDEDHRRAAACASDLATPHEILERAETRTLVMAAIDRLPDPYRVVLMLRDIEDLDTGEVAEALALTETNVKVRLHRARLALRREIEPLLQRRPADPHAPVASRLG